MLVSWARNYIFSFKVGKIGFKVGHGLTQVLYTPKQDPKILNKISAKQSNDICTTETDYKKALRYKGTSRAQNLYTYCNKNKDRNHTINSREMLQTSDKSTKKPQLQVQFSLLKRRALGLPDFT